MEMKLFLCVVILLMWSSEALSDHCVWYDECYHDDFAKNCPYNGTAKSLNETGVKILEKWCPSFMQTFSEHPVKTCCSVRQLQTLDSSLQMGANFLKRCPSCMMNFASLFCEFTCAPNQSNFMKIMQTQTEKNVSYITAVDVYVNNTYLNGIFDSCSHVSVPSTGELALDLMCGDYGASRCNSERWFKFLGDPDLNPMAPFLISFVNATPGFVEFHSRIIPCNESYSDNTTACSCIDCVSSCPAPPPPLVPPNPFTILGYSGLNVIMFLVFLLLLTLLVCKCVQRPVKAFFEYGMRSDEEFSEPNEQTPLVRSDIRPGTVDDSCCGNFIYRLLQKFFYKLGLISASYPKSVLFIGAVIISTCSYGITFTKLTTDPVQLWSSPNSGARIEKDYFDANFGPFYRTEQIIIKPVGIEKIVHNTSLGPVEFGPVFNRTFLLEVFDLQRQIELLGNSTEDSLENICFAPLSSPFRGPVQVSDCMVQSIWGYYQDDLDVFDETTEESNFTVNYLDHFKACSQNPYNIDCLARYKGPVDPALAVGGFLSDNDTLSGNTQYEKANALIISFIVNNYNNETALQPALRWEKRFIEFMKNWTKSKPVFMDVAFSSERSIQDELQRSSEADVKTVFISYMTMFLYVALALGNISRLGNDDASQSQRSRGESSNLCWKIVQYIASGLIGAKITLGLGGVCMVLASVAASVGVFGFVGVPVTMIIIEVMPFLVLAIGVDNIFIIVQSYQRSEKLEDESKEQHIGRILSSVGPSILLSTMSECLCFFLGATSGMPAVREFAVYAGLALVINFLLQVSCFVSLLSLDSSHPPGCCCCSETTCPAEAASNGLLYEFFKAVYVPFLMINFVRFIVLMSFFGLFCFSVTLIPKLDVGLDQELAMPKDSYVSKYFKFLSENLCIGPPVYFVVEGNLDYSQSDVQNTLCGGQYCNHNSLTTQVFSASRRQNETHIARPANSWLDDYFDWSDISGCCKYFSNNGTFCPNDHDNCRYCNISFDHFNRPHESDFKKYLPFFLQDNPTKSCAKAGHAAYSSAVKYKQDKNGLANVTASYFMSYHTPVKKSKDYYEALQSALTLSENISLSINKALHQNLSDSDIKVFPYSVFYVFYEQYLTMWSDTLKILGISVAGIFVVTFILMNFDVVAALILTVTIAMIVVDIFGVMFWWNISLNAVSLINLVLSLGISVEFCSHILHFYVHSDSDTRLLKASDSLSNVGSSVFSGITLTKFVGITVLAFAKSPLFQVFYFRMYLLIVLFGAAHGLIFLPVFLSAVGPQRTKAQNGTKPINSEIVQDFENS